MRLRSTDLGVTFPSPGGPVHALRGVRFETRENEFLCIVGPSGCGKTTLLRVVAGIQSPHEGAVEHIPSPSDRNRDILLVSQERNLFPWMTVIDNAAFGLEMQGVPRGRRRKLAHEILARMGFEGREMAWPHELSLGMKQRVAVARCFLSDPAVMLMDEPFAALDCLRRLELQQELLRLWEESPKTVIFVTHDVEEAILLSDRVLVLSRQPGRVVSEFRVPFPRPRTAGITMTDEFLDLKRTVSGALGLSFRKEAACR